LSTAYIHEAAARLIKRYCSRDPFEIAEAVGIRTRYDYNFTLLKGMYVIIERNRYAILNGNLKESVRRIVLAHELGHDALHRSYAKVGALKEFMLYDMSTRPEYEANVFAGELLLDDKKIFALAKDGCDVPNIAVEIGADYNLLLIKMEEMRKKGYDLRISLEADARFLAKTTEYDFETYDVC
jgi:Zn-dependent peptidase ImmA (M78 family)